MIDKIIQVIARPAEEPKYENETVIYGLSEKGNLYFLAEWNNPESWHLLTTSPEEK
ncbi:MAG: hypothetical protein ACOX6V_05050 [Patescibacteria group bacterium]|jgi:hypothetical protein